MKKGAAFNTRNVEAIVVDDDDNTIIHLASLSINDVVHLADMVFRNNYDLLIRRVVDDE